MVSENKKQLVQGLADDIKKYAIVGVVNLENLPAQQLQVMREMLRNKGVKLAMARKRLLNLALENSKKDGVKNLAENIKGMPALLFSNENPFSLYSLIQKNKSEAPAKAGQTCPKEIVVSAGATNFAPGPIISELAAVGIKTKVENGKLAIINDVVVAKEGDIISANLAEMLKRLDIKPMEVGLDLVAVLEDGTVFNAKQLHIDEAEFEQNIITAAQEAMNLAVEVAYPTADTTELLLQKAFREAKFLAVDQNIINDDTKEEILAKAEAQALSVKEAGKIEAQVEPKGVVEKTEEKVEEKPAEETPKEEAKVEEPAQEEAPVEEETPTEETTEAPVEEETPAEEPTETTTEEPVQEEKKEEPVAETPVEEPKVEEKTEEALAEEPKTEQPVEEKEEPVKEEEKPTEEPKEEKVPTAAELIQEDKEQQLKEDKLHPKQGSVSTDQAQELLEKLQKEGTLRDN
jgi:large subunit ribosomal protein L10